MAKGVVELFLGGGIGAGHRETPGDVGRVALQVTARVHQHTVGGPDGLNGARTPGSEGSVNTGFWDNFLMKNRKKMGLNSKIKKCAKISLKINKKMA